MTADEFTTALKLFGFTTAPKRRGGVAWHLAETMPALWCRRGRDTGNRCQAYGNPCSTSASLKRSPRRGGQPADDGDSLAAHRFRTNSGAQRPVCWFGFPCSGFACVDGPLLMSGGRRGVIQAQKVRNDLFNLKVRQLGVWHFLWIGETPMCRLHKMCQ